MSPCIDAGDRARDYSQEPQGNGKRINLGRYGNTSEARARLTAVLFAARFPRLPGLKIACFFDLQDVRQRLVVRYAHAVFGGCYNAYRIDKDGF